MKTASLKSAGTKDPVFCGFYEPFLVNWYKVHRAIGSGDVRRHDRMPSQKKSGGAAAATKALLDK